MELIALYLHSQWMRDDNAKLNPWPLPELSEHLDNQYFFFSSFRAAAYAYYPGIGGSADGVIALYTYVEVSALVVFSIPELLLMK